MLRTEAQGASKDVKKSAAVFPFPDRQSQVSANGLIFNVYEWGDASGRELLLLHGLPQGGEAWGAVADELANAGIRAIAFDQRGYSRGALPASQGDYNFEAFVADTFAVADAVGLDHFDLAGFGMGAAQAWIAAAQRPDRVRSLVALRYPHPVVFAHGTSQDPVGAEAWKEFQKKGGADLPPQERAEHMLRNNGVGLRDFLVRAGLPEPFVSYYVDRMSDAALMAGAFEWPAAIDYQAFSNVPKIQQPTLYVWSQTRASAPKMAQQTADYVTGPFRSQELAGVGNFLLEKVPGEVARLMKEFYAQHR